MLKMKSSRPATLKGQANQIIKQIVKVVLPSDVVQLQAGRRKKTKKGKKSVKKPSQAGRPPRPPRPPQAPEGFLSHTIRPDQPPPPTYPSVFGENAPRTFAQPAFQPVFQPPSLDKMFYEKLLKEKEKMSVGTSTQMTPRVETPIPVKREVIPPMDIKEFVPSLFSLSLQSTPSPSPRVGSFSLADTSVRLNLPYLALPPPLQPATPYSAPNRANQPSFDVDGDGKEAIEIRPQIPAVTSVRQSRAPSPYQQVSSSSAAAAVFEEAKYASPKQAVEEEEFPEITSEDIVAPYPPGSPRQSAEYEAELERRQLDPRTEWEEVTDAELRKLYKLFESEIVDLEKERRGLEPPRKERHRMRIKEIGERLDELGESIREVVDEMDSRGIE